MSITSAPSLLLIAEMRAACQVDFCIAAGQVGEKLPVQISSWLLDNLFVPWCLLIRSTVDVPHECLGAWPNSLHLSLSSPVNDGVQE
ncbi:uncharacterized protein B0H64DRAFT_408062 [Chaetomium fimeti]|uniref:Uncharacterized protein n=1 Tax=Chaetomium fimeti TaxID=1854472 RepID=A0AAE0LNL7_9PEZI|nr:hypothetical protein B0H64DRAFT_408062 [Chaetomium fimeti]